MSDTKYRAALRAAQADPTPKTIAALAVAAERAGVLHPLKQARGLRQWAALAHLTALEVRKGDPGASDRFLGFSYGPPSRPILSRVGGGFRRLMAKCVVGGLGLEDLEVLLRAQGLPIPRCLWSPGGEGFGELLTPEDYSTSGRFSTRPSEEATELYLGYEELNGNSVTLLDGFAIVVTDWDEEGSPSRLDRFQVYAHRGFTAEDISEEDYEQISENVNLPIDEIKQAVSAEDGWSSLCQAAFEVRHQRGPAWDGYPLHYTHPQEVRVAFALEIAMDSRGFLK